MLSKNQTKVLAIDIGATNIRFATVIREKIEFLEKKSTPSSEEDLLDLLEKQIKDRLAEADISGVAISIAGPVKEDGSVYLTNITKSEISIARQLGIKISSPIVVINDTDAAVLAEKEYGVGKGITNLMYVTLSSGVGGGLIFEGKLTKATSVSEEVGHQSILSGYDALCTCGAYNHWEAFSSGLMMPNFMKLWLEKNEIGSKLKDYDDVLKIYEAAKRGDSLVRNFLREVGKINAQAIDMFFEKYNLELVVLGGAIALNNSEIVLADIFEYQESNVPVKITNLGDEISLLGSAVYFRSQKED